MNGKPDSKPTESLSDSDRECLNCAGELTGKQEKFCCPKCRAAFHRAAKDHPVGKIHGISRSRNGWIVSVWFSSLGNWNIGDAAWLANDTPMTKIIYDPKEVALPDIPDPTHFAGIKMPHVPHRPGVYFIWDGRGEKIQYVGHSRSLFFRVSLHHPHINTGTPVSMIVAESVEDAFYLESIFIGILRPPLNAPHIKKAS